MDRWLLTFFIGAILSLFLAEVPEVFQLFLLFFMAVSSCFHKKLRYSSGLWFGALWMLSHGYVYQHQLSHHLTEMINQQKTIVIEGTILDLQNQHLKATNKSNSSKVLTGVSTKHTNKTIKNLAKKSEETSVIKDKANKTLIRNTHRFNFNVVKVNSQRLSIPINIKLSWRNPALTLWQGQQLALQVKLKAAHGLSNVGGFNYVSWLKTQNIVATGYVKNTKKHKGSDKNSLPSQQNNQHQNKLINRQIAGTPSFRQGLYDQFHKILPSHALTPILVALAFGERSLLSDSHWHILQNTGTSHLIAISGLHIGLLASGSFYLFMLLLRLMPFRDPRWQRLNTRYVAIMVSLLMASLYAYLAGFSLPTQRALVMLYLYWLARVLGIKLSLKRLLLVTLLVLLILSPFSVMTASFWLSFYAVTIIFLTLWRFKAWLTTGSSLLQLLKGLLLIQVMLTLMLIPVTALFFQKISLVSLLANIIAVPWMSFISIPAALLSIMMTIINDNVAQLFMMISLYSLDVLWQYLTLLSTSTYANVGVSQQTQFIMLLIGIVLFIVLFCVPLTTPFNFQLLTLFKGLRGVLNKLSISIKNLWSMRLAVLPLCWGAISMMIILAITVFLVQREYYWSSIIQQKAGIISKHFFSANDVWQVVFFDVGQGLSILIKRSNKAILYDTGASFPSGFSMSEAVILPYLQYAGIDYLDKVILSHSDNDHAGGLNTLLKNIPILEVMSNDNQVQQSLDYLQLTTRQESCHSEGSFSWQELNFTILWPLPHHRITNHVNANQTLNSEASKPHHKPGNDDSCVILIADKQGNSFLLSGDISTKVEKQLVLRYPNLRAEVLQVPHHGSKTSSSLTFLRHLNPTLAVVSAGYLNRWRMPVAEVRDRYAVNDIRLINNADVGQIVVTFNSKGFSHQSFIENLRPFWFIH